MASVRSAFLFLSSDTVIPQLTSHTTTVHIYHVCMPSSTQDQGCTLLNLQGHYSYRIFWVFVFFFYYLCSKGPIFIKYSVTITLWNCAWCAQRTILGYTQCIAQFQGAIFTFFATGVAPLEHNLIENSS